MTCDPFGRYSSSCERERRDALTLCNFTYARRSTIRRMPSALNSPLSMNEPGTHPAATLRKPSVSPLDPAAAMADTATRGNALHRKIQALATGETSPITSMRQMEGQNVSPTVLPPGDGGSNDNSAFQGALDRQSSASMSDSKFARTPDGISPIKFLKMKVENGIESGATAAEEKDASLVARSVSSDFTFDLVRRDNDRHHKRSFSAGFPDTPGRLMTFSQETDGPHNSQRTSLLSGSKREKEGSIVSSSSKLEDSRYHRTNGKVRGNELNVSPIEQEVLKDWTPATADFLSKWSLVEIKRSPGQDLDALPVSRNLAFEECLPQIAESTSTGVSHYGRVPSSGPESQPQHSKLPQPVVRPSGGEGKSRLLGQSESGRYRAHQRRHTVEEWDASWIQREVKLVLQRLVDEVDLHFLLDQ